MENRVKLFIVVGIGIALVSGGTLFYFQRSKSLRKSQDQTRILESLRRQSEAFQRSPFQKALEAKDVTKAVEILGVTKDPAALRQSFQSTVSYIDTHPEMKFSTEQAAMISKFLVNYIRQNLLAVGSEAAKAKVLAARLLSRLVRNVEASDLQSEILELAQDSTVDESMRVTLMETLGNFETLSDQSFGLLTDAILSKDSGYAQSALLISEQLKDETRRKFLINWLNENVNKISTVNQPLAFRIFATNSKDSSRVDQLLVQNLRRKEEVWRDACLSVLATIPSPERYRKDLEVIAQKTESPVLRQRAEILLAELGRKSK